MKKFVRILSLILVFALLLAPVTFAKMELDTDKEFVGSDGLDSIFSTGVSIIKYVGYGVAAVMILWLGIQWMIAQPAKKAELKGKMWSMAIGIIILVAGVTILDLAWNMAGDQAKTIATSQGN